ncbi:MAG: hypothetical protein IKE21_04850 [Erysipelotrichaceae bacterium]|nr:hypothetical protein [Erysipelotrichaceae bacterium]
MRKLPEILQILAECALYCATLAFLLTPGQELILFFLLLCAAELLCYFMKEKGGWTSIAPLGLLLLSLLPGISFPRLFRLLPALLYLHKKCRERDWRIDHERLLSFLPYGFGAEIATAFLSYTIAVSRGAVYAQFSLPFFLLWCLITVFLLRILRSESFLQEGNFLHYNLLSMALLSILALALVSKGFQYLLLMGILGIYVYGILPILLLLIDAFIFLLNGLGRFLGLFIKDLHFEFPEQQIDLNLDFSFGEEAAVEAAKRPEWISFALRTGALLLAGVLLFLFLRHFFSRIRPTEDAGTSVVRSAYTVEEAPKKKKRAFFRRGTREVYRRFLKACRKEGLSVRGASDEIAAAAGRLSETETAEELRKLYLPIRYGQKEDSQEREAKELLRQWQKEVKQN